MSLRSRFGKKSSRKRLAMCGPQTAEVLEDRALLATFNLTTLADDGSAGTLRSAILQSNLTPEADTINIPSALHGTTVVYPGGLISFEPTGSLIKLNGLQLPTVNGKVSLVAAGGPPEASDNTLKFKLSADNLSRAFQVGPAGELSIQNLVIQDGKSTGDGGAILNQGQLSLNAVEILNSTALRGGAIASTSSSRLVVDNSVIKNNTASSGEGGALSNESLSSIFLIRSTISNNTASKSGGGISVGALSNVLISQSDITNNNSGKSGGGIAIESNSTLIIDNSRITHNKAIENGGGVWSAAAFASFDTVTVSNNTVTGLDNTTLRTNENVTNHGASVSGGGLAFTTGTVQIVNSSINDNVLTAGDGGPGGKGESAGKYRTAGFGVDGVTGITGGVGITGGNGGDARGAGISIEQGMISISSSTVANNSASGGAGGQGGTGGTGGEGQRGGDRDPGSFGQPSAGSAGDGGLGGIGGTGGIGGAAGIAQGGGIYAGLSVTNFELMNSTVAANQAIGGQAGKGGTGGVGGRGGDGGFGGTLGSIIISGRGNNGGTGGTGGTTGAVPAVEGGGIYFSPSENPRLITSSTIAYNSTKAGQAAASLAAGGQGGARGISGAGNTFIPSNGAVGNTGAAGMVQPAAGGGIFQNDAIFGTGLFKLALKNTIVGRNSAINGSSLASNIGGTLANPAASSSNLIGAGGSGGLVSGTAGNLVGVTENAIGLIPVSDNGGGTLTVAISRSSPAYNAGDNAVVQAAGFTTDQRGLARIAEGRVDIGAIELSESLVVTTLVDENDGTTDPGVGAGTSLHEAIALANARTGLQTITFAAGLTGTIDLNSSLPRFTGTTSIVGPGANLLTIRRNNIARSLIFHLLPSSDVKLFGLTIANANNSAIYSDGVLEIHDSVFDGNSSSIWGGAIRSYGPLVVRNSAFVNNSSFIGGAIHSLNTTSIENSTFHGNVGGSTAAISLEGTTARIDSVTIHSNNAGSFGSLLVNRSVVTIENTIVSSNNGDAIYNLQGTLRGSHNLVTSILVDRGDASGFTGTISSDPKLGPLQNNGGRTPTMALLPGSPALNAGNNSLLPENVTNDQRGTGFSRIRGGTVDIGAFELPGELPTITSNQATVAAAEGGMVTNSGSFGDPQDRNAVTLTASLGTITRNDTMGTWQWSYVPPDDLSAPVEVVITAKNVLGMKAQTKFPISVANVSPTIRINGERTVVGGSTYTLNLGAVTDPGTDTVTQYIVHWGDGTSNTYTSPGNKTHVYPDSDAMRFITVDLIDEDGSHLNTASISASATNYAVGQQPTFVTKADFNKDGRPDLMTVDGQSATVSVLRNNGAGGFAPAETYSVGLLPGIATVGDFNGDGYSDIAVAHYMADFGGDFSNSVSVLINAGDGTFLPSVEYASGTAALFVTSADFNNDGRTDLVTTNDVFGDVTVLMSSAAGGFDQPVSYTAGVTPRGIAVGDFNKDGKVDFAVANAGGGNVSLFFNSGNGSFQSAVNIAAGVQPFWIVSGEFNGDSNPDLAVSDSANGNVMVMIGNGLGAFNSPTTYSTESGFLTIGDFNNDGAQDLAAGGTAVNVLLNSGSGSFTPSSRLSVPNGAQSMVAADLNGDGLQEFAVVSNAADTVSILPGPALKVTRFTPTGLTVSDLTQDMTPTITWTSVATAVSYEVYLKNQDTNQVIQQNVTGASWTPSADLGIGRFRFWVRSVNAAGAKSAWSLPTVFTVNTAVTVPSQTLGQTVRPTVTWLPLAGAVSYEVWLNDSSRKITPLMRQSGVTSTSWTPSSDLALGTYTFWVRGIDAVGRVAAWSSKLTFNVQAAPTPSSLMASTFSRQPEFRWTAPAGSASFVVTLANQTTGATQTIPGITGTSWTPTSNLADGRWTWRVRAVSQFGGSTYWSDLAQLQIGGQTVVSTPTGNRTSPVTFNWLAVSGAASYSLWVNRVDVPQAVIRRDNITTNSFTTSTPLAAGTYRVWVRAVSTTGEVSIWNRTVEFTVASSDRSGENPFDQGAQLDDWKLTSLLTPHEQTTADELGRKSTPIMDQDSSDAQYANDNARDMINVAVAEAGHLTSADLAVERQRSNVESLSEILTLELIDQLDEVSMHELLQSL